MDIAALSTVLAQGKTMSQVSVSLAKMGMNQAKQQGQALQQLVATSSMQQSVTPPTSEETSTSNYRYHTAYIRKEVSPCQISIHILISYWIR